jgi:hypothetical protein
MVQIGALNQALLSFVVSLHVVFKMSYYDPPDWHCAGLIEDLDENYLAFTELCAQGTWLRLEFPADAYSVM